MALAKILLPLRAGSEQTAACDLALRVARMMSARIEVMCATAEAPHASRSKERVFVGTTRHVLASTRIPLLLTH